jgi:hypothetical protein
MFTMADTPTTKLKEFIADQVEVSDETNGQIKVTFTTFDQEAETYFDNVNVKKMQTITDDMWETMMKPRGTTRLIDTIWECVEKKEIRIAKYMESLPPAVKALNPVIKNVVVVLTDGQDNQSSHSATELNIKLNELRKKDWILIFLAANQDAMITGTNFGFSMDQSLTIGSDPTTSSHGMTVTNQMCRGISSGTPATPSFTAMDRQRSVPSNQIPPPPANQQVNPDLQYFQPPPPINRIHRPTPYVGAAQQPAEMLTPPPPETTPISSHVSFLPHPLSSPPHTPANPKSWLGPHLL